MTFPVNVFDKNLFYWKSATPHLSGMNMVIKNFNPSPWPHNEAAEPILLQRGG